MTTLNATLRAKLSPTFMSKAALAVTMFRPFVAEEREALYMTHSLFANGEVRHTTAERIDVYVDFKRGVRVNWAARGAVAASEAAAYAKAIADAAATGERLLATMNVIVAMVGESNDHEADRNAIIDALEKIFEHARAV
jgi:hypothetical protein